MRYLLKISSLFLLAVTPVCAAGGVCPTSAQYTNPSNPLGAQVTLASLGITSCYFVAANGADTNTGTDEAHPWLHSPHMPNCSATCATVQNSSGMTNTNAAGLGFILRGGDTWFMAAADSNTPNSGGTWQWNNGQTPNGTVANPIYIGVDQTWFAGASWARPILTSDNPLCGPNNVGGACSTNTLPTGVVQYFLSSCSFQVGNPNNMIDFTSRSNYILDNLELTGLCVNLPGQPGKNNYVRYGSINGNLFFLNLYVHGWSHVQFVGQNTNAACATGVCVDLKIFQGNATSTTFGDVLRFVVADGSDSDPESGGVCFKGLFDTAYSVFRYTGSCLPNPLHTFHDNLYEWFYENGHSDVLAFTENASVTDVVYNNVFRHIDVTGATGTPVLWPNPPQTTTVYVFNNLFYDIGQTEFFNIGNHGSNYGPYVIFNNTFQTGINQPILRCENQTPGAVTDVNNHYIDDGTVVLGPCPTLTTTTALTQTNAVATSTGYTNSQTFAYSPTLVSSPTVITGTNKQAFCTTLSGSSDTAVQAAGAACQSDTTYACTYNSTAHTVSCPARTSRAKPASTAWDIGDYQFSASGSQAATPVCTPAAGTYISLQFVTCSDSSAGAVMCYRVDGGTPATNGISNCSAGALYTGAINIVGNTTLTVIAGGTNYTDSAVLSQAYTITNIGSTPILAWLSK